MRGLQGFFVSGFLQVLRALELCTGCFVSGFLQRNGFYSCFFLPVVEFQDFCRVL